MTRPVGAYRPVVRAGGWLAVSGQIGIVDGKLVHGGFRAEADRALRNLAELLEGEGASLADVVKTTVYLRHMGDYPILNEVFGDHFGDVPPARAAVAVSELPLHALVELDAWAWVGGD
ncbi:MAG: RidA family protein [Actinomycetota bacterium]